MWRRVSKLERPKKSQLEDVQIISPVSLADVPFELNIPYITEALRLGNFALKSEKAGKGRCECCGEFRPGRR